VLKTVLQTTRLSQVCQGTLAAAAAVYIAAYFFVSLHLQIFVELPKSAKCDICGEDS